MKLSRILIVDDEEESRSQIIERLHLEFGLNEQEILEAEDGAQALNLARQWLPHVIVTDVNMPGLSGLQLLQAVSEDKILHSEVIIITGRTSDDTPIEALRGGASDYLQKPINLSELILTIRRALERWEIGETHARLVRQVKEDLAYGQEIQNSLLTESSKVGQIFERIGYKVAIVNRAPETVSGDFYLPKIINSRSAGFFLADTCGHGIPAALISMRILGLLEHLRSPLHHASDFLDLLNADFERPMPQARFVAGSYLILDKQGKFCFSNAAQPYPVLVKNGIARLLEVNGSQLGQFHDLEYEDKKGFMAPGDRLALYTDGVTEADNPAKGLYGEERLATFMQKHSDTPLAQLPNKILKDVMDFTGQEEFEDDVTIVIFEKVS